MPAGVFTKVHAKILPLSVKTLVYSTIPGIILSMFFHQCLQGIWTFFIQHMGDRWEYTWWEVTDQVLWRPMGLLVEWRTERTKAQQTCNLCTFYPTSPHRWELISNIQIYMGFKITFMWQWMISWNYSLLHYKRFYIKKYWLILLKIQNMKYKFFKSRALIILEIKLLHLRNIENCCASHIIPYLTCVQNLSLQ